MNDVRKYMGYCPQFDALDGLLTGRELLVYYSEIRGMSRKDGEKVYSIIVFVRSFRGTKLRSKAWFFQPVSNLFAFTLKLIF